MNKEPLDVLIVDDDRATRHRFTEYLGNDYSVEQAGTLDDALEMARARRPSAATVDFDLEEHTGNQVAQGLRRIRRSMGIAGMTDGDPHAFDASLLDERGRKPESGEQYRTVVDKLLRLDSGPSETTTQLDIDGSTLYKDGEAVFTIPGHNSTKTGINVVGAWGHELLLGTGTCCHGHVVQLVTYASNDEEYTMEQIVTPDTNVQDMVPARRDPSGDVDVLVAGQGCSGSGVRYVGIYTPEVTDIVSTEEFREYQNEVRRGRNHVLTPELSVDLQDERITLDLHEVKTRTRPGKQRDPAAPDFILTPAEETYVPSQSYARRDLTDRLHQDGVDIESTLTEIARYERMRAN